MRELLFKNAVFHEGLNYTVRLGRKWADIEIGEYVKTPTGFAEIVEIYICRLGEIPDRVLELEHDPNCNRPHNLMWAMRKVYPEIPAWEEFKDNPRIVTCLGFYVYEKK